MDQSIINWVFSGFSSLIVFILGAIWQAIRSLQKTDMDIMRELTAIEVLVAGNYVKRDEFRDMIKTLFTKLDKIEDKIDHKADK